MANDILTNLAWHNNTCANVSSMKGDVVCMKIEVESYMDYGIISG